MRRPVGRKVFATIGRCPFTRSVLEETTMSKLFTPTPVGPYRLSHRVVMAPLTRMRSDPGDIPSDLMVKYYSQRASKGGLIISEATPVSIPRLRLRRRARHLFGPSDRRMALRHRCGSCQGRPDLPAVVACRPSVAHRSAAEWRAAGRAVRDRGRRLCLCQA